MNSLAWPIAAVIIAGLGAYMTNRWVEFWVLRDSRYTAWLDLRADFLELKLAAATTQEMAGLSQTVTDISRRLGDLEMRER